VLRETLGWGLRIDQKREASPARNTQASGAREGERLSRYFRERCLGLACLGDVRLLRQPREMP
jgi:hypothetical protein